MRYLYVPVIAATVLTASQAMAQLEPVATNNGGIVESIGGMLGISAGTLAVVLLILRQVAEIGGKVIPDDATGFMALLRKACKVVAGYVPNKPTK